MCFFPNGGICRGYRIIFIGLCFLGKYRHGSNSGIFRTFLSGSYSRKFSKRHERRTVCRQHSVCLCVRSYLLGKPYAVRRGISRIGTDAGIQCRHGCNGTMAFDHILAGARYSVYNSSPSDGTAQRFFRGGEKALPYYKYRLRSFSGGSGSTDDDWAYGTSDGGGGVMCCAV